MTGREALEQNDERVAGEEKKAKVRKGKNEADGLSRHLAERPTLGRLYRPEKKVIWWTSVACGMYGNNERSQLCTLWLKTVWGDKKGVCVPSRSRGLL